jgi:hypothetical protein
VRCLKAARGKRPMFRTTALIGFDAALALQLKRQECVLLCPRSRASRTLRQGADYLVNYWVERFRPVKDCEVRIRKHTVKEMRSDARRRYEHDIRAAYALEFLSYQVEEFYLPGEDAVFSNTRSRPSWSITTTPATTRAWPMSRRPTSTSVEPRPSSSNAWQEARGRRWPEGGDRDRGSQRFGPPTLVEARRMASTQPFSRSSNPLKPYWSCVLPLQETHTYSAKVTEGLTHTRNDMTSRATRYSPPFRFWRKPERHSGPRTAIFGPAARWLAKRDEGASAGLVGAV